MPLSRQSCNMSVSQCVTLLLLLADLTTTSCTTWNNACAVGGSLVVFSVPGNLPVTAHYCNIVYDKEAFQLQPRIRLLAAIPGETYSVVMIDPDALAHPEGTSFLQWLAANIPGEDLRHGNLKNATEVAMYQGPLPPEGTGFHRYQFYIYRQSPPTARIIESPVRAFFNLTEWERSPTEHNGVWLLGPLAGVQFRTSFNSIDNAAL